MKTKDAGFRGPTKWTGFPKNRDFKAFRAANQTDYEIAQFMQKSGALHNPNNNYYQYKGYYDAYVKSGQFAKDKQKHDEAHKAYVSKMNAKGYKIAKDIASVNQDRVSRIGEGIQTAGKFISDLTDDGIDTAVSNLVTSRPFSRALTKTWNNAKMFFNDVVDIFKND